MVSDSQHSQVITPSFSLIPTTFLVIYTYRQVLVKQNYRVTLFTWILYILYLPIDNVLWYLLSSNVYLVISLIMKVIIVFTVTDTVCLNLFRKLKY